MPLIEWDHRSILPVTLASTFESVLIMKALQHTGGRRIEAAGLLGIGRNTLTRKVQELKIDTKD